MIYPGEIIVTKKTNENGEEVEERTVRPHTYNEVFDTAYNLGRFLHARQLYYVEELYKMKFIGIYSKNRYEWFVTDWACVLFGITTVPLYDTLGV
jgi:long-subunit acyl-CoA synthetase (AMP-forming)